MDKLAEKLKADAERIDVSVSDDLDYRIEASLRGIEPLRPDAEPEAAAGPASAVLVGEQPDRRRGSARGS